MADQVTPNEAQRAVLDRGAAFELMVGVPGVKDELFKFLDEQVMHGFLNIISCTDTQEVFRLQGELRAHLQFMEKVDAARASAQQVAAFIRAKVDETRERQRAAAEDEFQRYHRHAARAEI